MTNTTWKALWVLMVLSQVHATLVSETIVASVALESSLVSTITDEQIIINKRADNTSSVLVVPSFTSSDLGFSNPGFTSTGQTSSPVMSQTDTASTGAGFTSRSTTTTDGFTSQQQSNTNTAAPSNTNQPSQQTSAPSSTEGDGNGNGNDTNTNTNTSASAGTGTEPTSDTATAAPSVTDAVSTTVQNGSTIIVTQTSLVSTSASPTAAPTNNDTGGLSQTNKIVVGVVVGVGGAILLGIAALFCYVKYRKNNQYESGKWTFWRKQEKVGSDEFLSGELGVRDRNINQGSNF